MDIIEELKIKSRVNNKLAEYISLVCDYDNEFYGKDFESNHKFIFNAVVRMRRNKEDETEIFKFLECAIDVHKKNFM